jgi:tetratricopeptide (TPR) repeat protein
MLMAQEQPAQALKEYETSNESTPNRLRGLYGAAKAADGARQQDKARAYFRKLVELTKNADTERAEIREAKAYLAEAVKR